MEQSPLYNQINQVNTPLDVKIQGVAKTGNWWLDPTKVTATTTNNLTIAHAKIKEFVCPSHDPYSSTPNIAFGSHYFILGPPKVDGTSPNAVFVTINTSSTDP